MGQPDSTAHQLRRIRTVAIITTVGLCVLVVAGGVVRLTGSGLGCDDWPNCNSERFVDVSSGHTAIEQINRLLSGALGIPTLVLAFLAYRTRGTALGARRLWWPSLGVLVTVVANGVVGGVAVRGDLHPALIQSHFLLAMVSIACGLFVVSRTGQVDNAPTTPSIGRLVGVLAALTAMALVTGTVVTGTGPHAGDEDIRRFGFDISTVARVHSVTVLVTLVVALLVAARARSGSGDQERIGALLSGWIFVGVLQGGIGYVQYFNGVPELLVGTHIAAATLLWVLTVLLLTRTLTVVKSRTRPTITTGVLESA